MKIIYQDLKCHRFSSIVLLLIVCLCSLSACSGGGHTAENISVSHEVFEPYGLAQGLKRFSFESDSIGYAATTSWDNQTGNDVANFTLSVTEDRGRTWRTVGKGQGEVLYLSDSENNIYYVTKKELRKSKEPSVTDLYGYEIWKTEKTFFAPCRLAKLIDHNGLYGVFGFHVFNDSTMCYFTPKSDSIKVSYDSGNTWGYIAMQQDSIYKYNGVLYSGDDVLDFDGNKICVGLGSEKGMWLFKVGVIDVYSGKQEYYHIRGKLYLKSADNLVATSNSLYKIGIYSLCDGNLRKISNLRWDSYSIEPHLLKVRNGIAVCFAGHRWSEGEKLSCVWASSNGGRSWRPVFYPTDIPRRVSLIPDRTGVSFMYPDYVNSKYVLHILKFQRLD